MDWTGEQLLDKKPIIKPFWEITKEEAQKCIDATIWSPVDREYFRVEEGFSSTFLTKGEMPVTMRVNLVKGIGSVLQLAEGYAINLDSKVHQLLNDRTNSSWPTTWFTPILTGEGVFTDVYSVMNTWRANHCAVSYGDLLDKN